MLSKFILVSETRFQNTETALKNQQASIQGLETQIDQLSKLISERPQGSLPSTIEPNSREHLNAISAQNKDGLIIHEPEIQQNNAMNKGREEVNDNDPEQELDEWREHKPRKHDKPKLLQNKPDTSSNQLTVGDKVLLDAVDPHIVTTTPNEKILLTVLSIFPFGTVEVSHPKFGTFKHTRPGTRACLKPWPNSGRDTAMRDGRVEAGHDFPKTRGTLCRHHGARRPWSLPQRNVGDRVLPRYVLQSKFGTPSLNYRKLHRRSYFRYSAHDPSPQVVMTNNDDPVYGGGGHECTPTQYPHLSLLVLEGFGTILFHLRPQPLEGLSSPPSLRYLHAILAHTLTRRRESTGIINILDAYYLWCMANAHVTDLTYFIAFAIRHQTERHRISTYTDRSDVPTRHHDYVTHADDRAPTWDRSSSVPSLACH
ncbi:hypothetical protein GOBAR_AA10247 [Gossypium barbadense]|uniref:Uncharacterized protein n=1 Tax=Gossypium barbadense TaxID=3634 RepID=A0A2P5Y4A6_GOSBA|nr:hypothetical protein GOBAR_AA10247 [Gossypium barbadense]